MCFIIDAENDRATVAIGKSHNSLEERLLLRGDIHLEFQYF